MKKVLSLAFITAAFLLGCSADGFFDSGNVDVRHPENNVVDWGKMCKVGEKCSSVKSKDDCDKNKGEMVTRSQCDPGDLPSPGPNPGPNPPGGEQVCRISNFAGVTCVRNFDMCSFAGGQMITASPSQCPDGIIDASDFL